MNEVKSLRHVGVNCPIMHHRLGKLVEVENKP